MLSAAPARRLILERLASLRETWQQPVMGKETGQGEARGGGIWIAVGAIAGAVVGAYLGQPSAGLVIGSGSGILVAVALWLADRRSH